VGKGSCSGPRTFAGCVIVLRCWLRARVGVQDYGMETYKGRQGGIGCERNHHWPHKWQEQVERDIKEPATDPEAL
jgi:hypothetical protein